MSTPIDLTQLPAPSVVEALDFETILATRKAHLVSLLPEAERAAVTALLELESEPATKGREGQVRHSDTDWCVGWRGRGSVGDLMRTTNARLRRAMLPRSGSGWRIRGGLGR